MNSFDLTCAILSSAAYQFLANDENKVKPPAGATEVAGARYPSLLSGFEAYAYTYDNKIIIAYAGTNTSQVGDMVTNLATGLGAIAAQLRQAAEFYLSIKNDPAYAGREIVLTGHSLGGGLAALMGVFFNERAVTFDPAPFRLAATQSNAAALRSYLASAHPEWPVNGALLGFTTVEGVVGLSVPGLNAALFAISPALALRVAILPFPITVSGENNIKAYSLTGEFLTNGYRGLASGDLNALRIQSGSQPEFITINPAGAALGAFDLHSMNLLIAAADEPRLATLFNDKPRLTEALFDERLYARSSSSPETDLLARLVQSEFGGVGTPASGTGLLTKLADDFDRFITVSDGMAAQPTIQRALTAATFDYYYFKDPAAATQLFTTEGNGIHFNYANIDQPQIGLQSPRLLAAAMQPFLSADEWAAVGHKLDTQGAWHVQSGSAGMTWTASGAAAYDAAIGGAGTDVLDGGAGDDILIGGAGRDFLTGGNGADILIGGLEVDTLYGNAGNDRLLGGAEADIYTFAEAFGADVIEDSDGTGSIAVTGLAPINGNGAKKTSATSTVWQSTDERVTYTVMTLGSGAAQRQDLVIAVARSDADSIEGTITVRNWTNGRMGITLGGAVADPATNTDIHIGDFVKLASTTEYSVDLHGYQGDEPAAGAADVLWGLSMDEIFIGLGGNDGIAGNGGADVIEGGAGTDLLLGGTGADVDTAIEDQWLSDQPSPAAPAWNHSQMVLADSLTVYALLSKLDPSLSAANSFALRNAA